MSSEIRVQVDGVEQSASPEETILGLLGRLQIEMPHVCWHPSLGALRTCDTCMVDVDLNSTSAGVRTVSTNVPLRRTNLTSLTQLRVNVGNQRQAEVFQNSPIDLNDLSVTLEAGISPSILKGYQVKDMLLIETDTLDIAELPFTKAGPDSLILYGHSVNLPKLAELYPMSYLGIYVTNEDSLSAVENYSPQSKKQLWCFPADASIEIDERSGQSLSSISIGDSVLAIGPARALIRTKVIALEYHFNVQDTVLALTYSPLLADRENLEVRTISTKFTPNHPLWTNSSVQGKTANLLDHDELYLTGYGMVHAEECELQLRPFSGTLINVRTEAGNFLINGVGFLNK